MNWIIISIIGLVVAVIAAVISFIELLVCLFPDWFNRWKR